MIQGIIFFSLHWQPWPHSVLAEKSMSCASILHFSWLKVWAMPPLLHAPSLIKVQGEISVYFLNILWWSFVVFLALGTFLFFFLQKILGNDSALMLQLKIYGRLVVLGGCLLQRN